LLTYLYVVQIIIALALIVAILFQAKGSDLGSLFGGGGGGGIYKTRRGAEKTLFNLTIVLSVVFFAISLATVILQKA
jgi:preprotein translocase subunit SecG